MKTDRTPWLRTCPAKTELTVHCGLGKVQVALYEEAVRDLANAISRIERGIARRGNRARRTPAPEADLQSPLTVDWRR